MIMNLALQIGVVNVVRRLERPLRSALDAKVNVAEGCKSWLRPQARARRCGSGLARGWRASAANAHRR